VFAWNQVRDAAERAADENEVSPGEVNGCAEVLLVEGSWWHIVAPGIALCSIAAARDPAIAPVILKEAFDSYLAGQGSPNGAIVILVVCASERGSGHRRTFFLWHRFGSWWKRRFGLRARSAGAPLRRS